MLNSLLDVQTKRIIDKKYYIKNLIHKNPFNGTKQWHIDTDMPYITIIYGIFSPQAICTTSPIQGNRSRAEVRS